MNEFGRFSPQESTQNNDPLTSIREFVPEGFDEEKYATEEELHHEIEVLYGGFADDAQNHLLELGLDFNLCDQAALFEITSLWTGEKWGARKAEFAGQHDLKSTWDGSYLALDVNRPEDKQALNNALYSFLVARSAAIQAEKLAYIENPERTLASRIMTSDHKRDLPFLETPQALSEALESERYFKAELESGRKTPGNFQKLSRFLEMFSMVASQLTAHSKVSQPSLYSFSPTELESLANEREVTAAQIVNDYRRSLDQLFSDLQTAESASNIEVSETGSKVLDEKISRFVDQVMSPGSNGGSQGLQDISELQHGEYAGPRTYNAVMDFPELSQKIDLGRAETRLAFMLRSSLKRFGSVE